MSGRIWFPGNPWPDGHAVAEFAWTGRIDEAGRLWFDLSLCSSDYDEEADPPDDPDEDDDWRSVVVWNNYHSCWLSSTAWPHATGVLAATPEHRFRFIDTHPQRLCADPLPIKDSSLSPAFRIYLLGHDSVAGHQLKFIRESSGGHRIEWTGRVALTYAGDTEFRYGFRAQLRNITLAHIGFPDDMPTEEARRHLARLVDIPDRFVPSAVDGQRVLVPTDHDPRLA